MIQSHKIINNACLDYLSDLLPPLASTTNLYHRRRFYERLTPPFRTELYRSSFFPSTTLLWNNLPVKIQERFSLGELKYYLTMDDNNVPSHYYLGKMTEPIIICKLCLEMSDLNFDLFSRHLIDNPSCACGLPFETAEHFLVFCPNYQNECTNTIMHLPDKYLDIHTFFFGDQSLGPRANEAIFRYVHEYIRQTPRFYA